MQWLRQFCDKAFDPDTFGEAVLGVLVLIGVLALIATTVVWCCTQGPGGTYG